MADVPEGDAPADRAELDRWSPRRVLALLGRGIHHVLHDRRAEHAATCHLLDREAVRRPVGECCLHAPPRRLPRLHLQRAPTRGRPPAMSYLRIDSATKAFDGFPVVHAFSLDIEDGEF